MLEGPVLIVAKSTDDLTKAPSLENSVPWRKYFHVWQQICLAMDLQVALTCLTQSDAKDIGLEDVPLRTCRFRLIFAYQTSYFFFCFLGEQKFENIGTFSTKNFLR